MGPAEHRLSCTWYVDRNWRDNLSKINGGSEKKPPVYKTLRVLLQMISIDEFKSVLDQFINDLLLNHYIININHLTKRLIIKNQCWKI